MMQNVVYVVDDDESVRTSLVRLLSSAGYLVEQFSSAAEFLLHGFKSIPGCLILDINMPGQDGFHVLEALAKMGRRLPTIFITGVGTIPMSVRAMKAGASEFLTKPVCSEQLLSAVESGLVEASTNLAAVNAHSAWSQRYQTLTARERQILELAIGGLLNKQIAAELGVSEITAKVHKRRVMEKMQTRTLADLVRASERLGIVQSRSR